MEKFDWKATISVNILKLKMVGLWPRANETYKLNLYTVWAILSVSCIIFAHNFFQAVNIIFIINDLEAVAASAFISLSELLGVIKSYYLIQNMAVLKELMATLATDTFQPRNSKQREMVKPDLKFWKMIYKMYWSMSGGALFFWATFPILDNSVKDYRLPFLAWYPFDTRVSPNYELTYFYQVIGVLFVATATLSVDTLIAALNMYIGTQIDILCDDLRNISDSDSFNKRFLLCIEHHKTILRFVENSNRFYNWIVFLQFFISATSIGITLFQMTLVAPLSSEFFSILSFELAIVVEIFMYCWFGNEIEEKSKQIPYAIFESNWTGTSIEVKKNIIIFMLRSQRPIKVSAVNVFYMSVETFMKILRTSWSYFVLLHQMASRK